MNFSGDDKIRILKSYLPQKSILITSWSSNRAIVLFAIYAPFNVTNSTKNSLIAIKLKQLKGDYFKDLTVMNICTESNKMNEKKNSSWNGSTRSYFFPGIEYIHP